MTLTVTRTDGGYLVDLRRAGAESWTTPAPLAPTQVLEELARRGCHSTDATDALDEADRRWLAQGQERAPSWAEVHDAEVLRRRGLT
jgi:hypothetical protein